MTPSDRRGPLRVSVLSSAPRYRGWMVLEGWFSRSPPGHFPVTSRPSPTRQGWLPGINGTRRDLGSPGAGPAVTRAFAVPWIPGCPPPVPPSHLPGLAQRWVRWPQSTWRDLGGVWCYHGHPMARRGHPGGWRGWCVPQKVWQVCWCGNPGGHGVSLCQEKVSPWILGVLCSFGGFQPQPCPGSRATRCTPVPKNRTCHQQGPRHWSPLGSSKWGNFVAPKDWNGGMV